MSVQVEKLEHNMAKLTFETDAAEVEKALQAAYLKQRKSIAIPGFRKGKVPRQIIEKMYGPEVFYEDAANELIPEVYEREIDTITDVEFVSRPTITDVNIKKGEPFTFVATLATKPPVELGKYKGVQVSARTIEVSDDEIQAEIDKERNKNARIIDVEDRAVKDGDMITLDFEGFVGDEPFEGGKGTDYPLTIGSNSFIPGFEDQLIGAEAGKETTVNVTFPEDYHEKSLAGEDAKFICTVKGIKEKELPELDNDFAQDLGFDTLDEYKESIKKNLTEEKESKAKNEKEDEIIEAIVADSKMDIPEAMIETEAEKLLENYGRSLAMQGMSLETYMQYTGLTKDKLVDQMKPQAEKSIKGRLVLQAVADAEDIQVSDEDYDAEIGRMAEMYQMEADELKKSIGEYEEKQIKNDIRVKKAIDIVRDNAKEA